MSEWKITRKEPAYLKAQYNLDWVILAKKQQSTEFIGFYCIANLTDENEPDTDIVVAGCASLADVRNQLIANAQKAFEGVSNLNGLIPSLAALEKLEVE